MTNLKIIHNLLRSPAKLSAFFEISNSILYYMLAILFE